jgi:predicted RNA-binding protein
MLLENVKPKDMMVSYVRPLRIRGIFKAVSKPFTSDEEIFNAAGFAEGELFPNRIKLEPVSMPEEPIEFKNLIPKLKFITNKKMWTGHLRRAMRTIPKEDFESIENAIRGK